MVQDSQTAALSVQDCHIRADLEFTNSLLHDKQVIELWYARPDRMRLEVLESTQPGFQEVISAFEGIEGWTYQRSDNSVSMGPTDSVKPAIVYDLVRSALDVLLEQRDVRTSEVTADYMNREWVYRLSGSIAGGGEMYAVAEHRFPTPRQTAVPERGTGAVHADRHRGRVRPGAY